MCRIVVLYLLTLSVVTYATPPEHRPKRVHHSILNQAGPSREVELGEVEVDRILGQLRERCLQGDGSLWQHLQGLVSNRQPFSKNPGLGISPYSKKQKNTIYYISDSGRSELPVLDLEDTVITKPQLESLLIETGFDKWFMQFSNQKIPLYIGKTEQVMRKRCADHLSTARHCPDRNLSQFLEENKENAYNRAIIINVHPQQLIAIEHYLIERYKPSLNSVSGTPGSTVEAKYFYGEVDKDVLGPTSPLFIPHSSSYLVPRSLKFERDSERFPKSPAQ